MSYSSRINILLWNNVRRMRHHYKCKSKVINSFKVKMIPVTAGFSFFTWLGFEDKKIKPEDELIQSIKHSVLFIQRNEYDKAERLLHIALRQAQQIQHQLGITYVYDVMANLALQRGQLDKAKSLFIAVTQRIMADGATEDDLRVIHISIKLARISHLKKEYEVAQIGYEWCLKKLNAAMKSGGSDDIVKLLALTEDWYGRLFVDCNNKENGLNLMISALNHIRTLDNVEKEHIVLQLNDLGTVCECLDKLDESISYFKEAIECAKEVEDKSDLGATYVNLGKVYIRKNMLEEARKSCGYGWRLGYNAKNEEIKNEAGLCIQQINSLL